MRGTSVYWLNAGPALSGFHYPLLQSLRHRGYCVRQWTLHQSEDEALTPVHLLDLLRDALSDEERPVHLVAHGSAGLLALRYAQTYPSQVASVGLLSVGPNPCVDWQYCYYTLLRSCQSDRRTLLRHLAQQLFGAVISPNCQRALYRILEADLTTSCSFSHLLQPVPTGSFEAPIPLWCGVADDDFVLRLQDGTENCLRPQTTFHTDHWSRGGHCFHYCEAQAVAKALKRFWQSLSDQCQPSPSPCEMGFTR